MIMPLWQFASAFKDDLRNANGSINSWPAEFFCIFEFKISYIFSILAINIF